MKQIIRLACLSTLAIAINLGLTQPSQASRRGEDPFPRICINLLGQWVSSDGERLVIRQNSCTTMRIARTFDGYHYAVEASLDGQPQQIQSSKWMLTESYRWNSDDKADALLASRNYSYSDRSEYEEIEISLAGPNTLREVKKLKTIFKNSDSIREKVTVRYLKRTA